MAIYSLDELLRQLNTRLSDASSDFWTEDTIFYAQLDLAESILPIVQSGNFTGTYSFKNDVLANKTVSVEKGLQFPTGKQTVPYPGTMSHSDFIGLENNDHSQYVTISGASMSGNLGIAGYIYSGGGDAEGKGITFRNISENEERFVIGEKTTLFFDSDKSSTNSITGTVNGFISFDATTDPLTVNSSFNIEKIEHVSKGKFVLYFTNNLSGNYIAITNTNGTADLDISFAKAACSFRKSDSCGFVVQNQFNQYINSKTNDIIILSIS